MYVLNTYQKIWLEDLENTTELQNANKLHTCVDGINAFCCLGRACYVLGLESEEKKSVIWYFSKGNPKGKTSTYAPRSVITKLKLRSNAGDFENPITYNGIEYPNLTEMNDAGISFKEIAAIIRTNPENVFL